MDRLQLATLLSWAGEGGLQGRKRLQKVVFLLQTAGCPLGCRYTLHHFGPYSRDVAEACDELVAAGLVEESGGPKSNSMTYSYSLTPATRRLLDAGVDPVVQGFENLGRELIAEDLWQLELGSTIQYFYGQEEVWNQALKRACEFKRVDPNDESSQRALTLAQRVHANGRQAGADH
jgi:uncharacterized protein YwgA